MTNEAPSPLDAGGLRRSAASNAFKLGLSMAGVLILGLFMRAYMPRNLGAELMGQFYFAESFPQMFFALLTLGIFAYIQRNIPGNPKHAGDILFTLMVFETGFAVVILVAMEIALALLGHGYRMLFLVGMMGLYTAAGNLTKMILKPLLLSLESVNLVSVMDVASKLVQVVLIVLVLWETSSLVLVVAVFAGVEVATTLTLLAAAGRRGILIRDFRPSLLKVMLTASLPFFLMNVFLMIYNNIDQTLLASLVNDVEVGLYGAAARLKGIFLMIVPILNLGIFPVMSRTFKEQPEHYLGLARDVLRCILFLSLPLVLAMMVFADVIVAILYGPEFVASARITCWLAPVLVMTYFNVFAATHLSLTTNGVRMAGVIFSSGLINVGLNFLLIPYGVHAWGVGGGGLGSALASLLGEVFCCAGLIWCSPMKLMNGRLTRALLAILLPSPILIFGFDQVMQIPLVWRMVGFAIGVPLFCFGSRLLTLKEAKAFVLMLFGKRRSLT